MIADNDCRFTNGYPHISLYCQRPIIPNYTLLHILIKSLCLLLDTLREQTFFWAKVIIKLRSLWISLLGYSVFFLSNSLLISFFKLYSYLCFVYVYMSAHLSPLHVEVRGQLKGLVLCPHYVELSGQTQAVRLCKSYFIHWRIFLAQHIAFIKKNKLTALTRIRI